jgi:hypothetical protein
MKTIKLLTGMVISMLLGLVLTVQSQTAKTICQVTSSSNTGDFVLTYGEVIATEGDDQFVIKNWGCSILCDGKYSRIPEKGSYAAVFGHLEITTAGASENRTLDVLYWIEEGEERPTMPDATFFNGNDVLDNAKSGDAAKITGGIMSWDDAESSMAVFSDGETEVYVDFEHGNIPADGQFKAPGTKGQTV